ncbi:MAG: hypothetical protein NTV22_19010 [bacterium]|nr:hypothetical protein [bacterium]
MKTTTTLAVCACLIVCATCAFAENIVSNGSFEVGSEAYADFWNGTIPGSMMRTNSAAHEGSWSEACKGGIDEWANVYQAIPQDLAGMFVRLTCWMMTPSNAPAVAQHPDWFGNCSAILKFEQPTPSTAAIQEIFAVKDAAFGGVYDTWIAVTNDVTSFPTNMTNFKVVMLGVMTSGVIYYDDVRLEVIPEPGLVAGGCLAGLLLAVRKLRG